MKFKEVSTLNIRQEFNSLFGYYPYELVEAALLPLLAKETDYCIDEPMNITHIFYAELNDIVQRSLIAYHQTHIYHEKQLVNENLKELSNIIHTLKEIIPISYIFCKNPEHDYASLTLVLKQHEYKPFNEIQNALSFGLAAYPKITCLVHAYNTMQDLISSGHFYFADLCNSTNCIYQNGNEPALFTTNFNALAESRLQATIVFKQNSHKASNFFAGAKHYIKRRENAMGTFMLQQACEFAYRSLIVAFKDKDIKSHDLIVLRKHVANYEPKIIGSFCPKIKKEVRLLTLLQEAYVKARYDHSFEIDGTQTMVLMNLTDNLIKGVHTLFNQYLVTNTE